MARIEGVSKTESSLISKILFWVAKRRLGRVSEMWRLCALVPRLHLGRAVSELLLDRSFLVDRRLRRLADIKAAMLLACPS